MVRELLVQMVCVQHNRSTHYFQRSLVAPLVLLAAFVKLVQCRWRDAFVAFLFWRWMAGSRMACWTQDAYILYVYLDL